MVKRKIRRITAFVCLLIIFLSCFGCKAKQENQTDTFGDIEYNPVISLKEQDSEAQPYWANIRPCVAKGDGGYYYSTGMLYFFDVRLSKLIPLCLKPDCTHSYTEDCYANHVTSQVYYYKDYVYTTRISDNNELLLVRINKDGSQRNDMFEINVGTERSGMLNVCLTFGDDCVYIYDVAGNAGSLDPDKGICIRRRSLDGKIDEIIYEYSGKDSCIETVKYYGGKLFFTVKQRVIDEETEEKDLKGLGLYAYDTETEKTVKVIDKSVCDYTINQEKGLIYYYVSGEGLYKRSLSEDNSELIYKSTDDTYMCYLSSDNKYVYIDNSRWINLSGAYRIGKQPVLIVVDDKGVEVNRIEYKVSGDMVFGDEDYLFLSNLSDSQLCILPKKDIKDAEEFIKAADTNEAWK